MPEPSAPKPAPAAAPAPEGTQLAALESPNADARREAALSLTKKRMEDAELRAQVSRRLATMAQGDAEALVRSAALQALLVQSPVQAVDIARRVRADESAMVRWDAAKVLGQLGGRPLMGALIEMLSGDTDENVRREAAKGLGRIDDPQSIRALISALDDPDLSVAMAARESLVKLSSGLDLGPKREPWEQWWK